MRLLFKLEKGNLLEQHWQCADYLLHFTLSLIGVKLEMAGAAEVSPGLGASIKLH